jgi:hypothetical protein
MLSQDEKAINVVRTARVEREPIDISIKSKQPAFGGTVYFVHWKSKKEDREMDSLSFFPVGSEEPIFLWGGEEAVKYFSALKPPGAVEAIGRYAFSLSGVAAIIALLVTVTICYLVIGGRAEVPGILANALTTILGFFFGSEVAKKKG